MVRVLRGTLHGTVRRLIVAHIGGQTRPALELSAAIEPGDSGAPVLDGDGRVLGVVFAESSDREDLAYAVDARALPTER
jgi:S1-C subfamily serine protease